MADASEARRLRTPLRASSAAKDGFMSEIRGLGGGDHDGAASGSADLMGSSAAEDGAVFTGSHNGSSSSSSRPPIARGVNARPNSPLRVNAYGAATGERGVNARPSTPQRYAAEAEATTSIVGFYSSNSDQDSLRSSTPLRVNAFAAATGERGVNARPNTPQRRAAETAAAAAASNYSGNTDQDSLRSSTPLRMNAFAAATGERGVNARPNTPQRRATAAAAAASNYSSNTDQDSLRSSTPLRVNAFAAATGERGVNARPNTPQRRAAEAAATAGANSNDYEDSLRASTPLRVSSANERGVSARPRSPMISRPSESNGSTTSNATDGAGKACDDTSGSFRTSSRSGRSSSVDLAASEKMAGVSDGSSSNRPSSPLARLSNAIRRASSPNKRR